MIPVPQILVLNIKESEGNSHHFEIGIIQNSKFIAYGVNYISGWLISNETKF